MSTYSDYVKYKKIQKCNSCSDPTITSLIRTSESKNNTGSKIGSLGITNVNQQTTSLDFHVITGTCQSLKPNCYNCVITSPISNLQIYMPSGTFPDGTILTLGISSPGVKGYLLGPDGKNGINSYETVTSYSLNTYSSGKYMYLSSSASGLSTDGWYLTG